MTGIMYRKKDIPKIFTIPKNGRPASLYEVDYQKVALLYRADDDCYLRLWDTYSELDGAIEPQPDLHVRQGAASQPDNDMAVDQQLMAMYTLGKKSIIKWDMSTVGLIDSCDLPMTPDQVKLNHDCSKLLVTMDDTRKLSVISTSTMLEILSFNLHEKRCIDFAISEDDKLIVSTHSDFIF